MVSADLRARVELAVRELHYIPNQLASALASSRTGRIGVIVPSLTNGVFDDYLRALHDLLVPAGFQVFVLNSNYVAGREEKAIMTALGQSPEAIILAGIEQTQVARRALAQSGIPVVQTVEIAEDPIDINIGLNHGDAGYAAARHLFELGHRRVGHLSAPLDSRALKRLGGFLQAAKEFEGVPFVVSSEQASSVALGGSLLAKLLEAPGISAVFCGNDNLALGAIFECQRRGLSVPRQLSIMGFNDLEFAASVYPSLSTIATPRYEMARRAAEIVLEITRGSGRRPKTRRIDLGFQLLARGSTSRFPSADL
jgi:LacI family gluconate utilization system Gnt-I transcriptional repressor